MNKAKWKAKDVPIEFLALKLVEEVGEVAREITDKMVVEDLWHGPEYIGHDDPDPKIITELDHVEFIARTLRKRLGG